MPNPFSSILGQHFSRFAGRISGGFRETSQQLDASSPDFTLGNLPPDQVLAMMQGNSAFMKQFEQSVEESFSRLGDRVLKNWMQNVDAEMRRGITDVIKTMEDFAGDASSIVQEGGSLSEALTKNSAGFGNALGNLAGGILKNMLTHTQTTIQESQRSQEAEKGFRNSRGQTQADLSEQLARGKRYT